jgi:3-oxoacyl-[acyl-carrier-protein] synthase II
VRRRVVITGCGVVTPAGSELASFWQALMSGACRIGPLRNFSCPGMDGLYGAEVDLADEDRLPPSVDSDPRRARCLQLGLAAARRALVDAGLIGRREEGTQGVDPIALASAGVVFGTTLGEERQTGDFVERKVAPGAMAAKVADGGFFTRANNHRLPALIAKEHGIAGPVLLMATACSSGNAALALAYDYVVSGETELMLAGGADTLTRLIYCGFQRMGALSKNICRPFDRHRDGVSFGEGAGALVLEELEHARRRGARMYAELAGYGISNDAHHITAPSPNGEGFSRAMQDALARSATRPEQVSYVSAHGTGTLYSDLGECQAMQAVFGEHAPRVPISSIKSMIGHTNGAASAIEAVACALALVHQAVPPTANLNEPEPGFDLDLVPGRGRPMPVHTCLSLAAGFGGFNACLVFKEAP